MNRPVVIGLAGGIGSGKSFVANLFAEAGCVIYDADREVTALYQRQDVLDTVRGWWGEEVVIDGEIDRASIAQIIFEDENQRGRLEGLLFPRLHERRRELIQEAAQTGAKAVVVDAPLLYEVALDEECDVVVFVDTPREIRLERLKARSGWDEGELSRREKAQLPLDAKLQRSDYSLDGSAAPEELRRRTLSLLDEIIAGSTGAS